MLQSGVAVLTTILDPATQELLKRERAALSDAIELLARVDLPGVDVEPLRRATRQLDELFLLVVVGEFNAGKSVFVNALLGRRLLEEGVTPTTSRIHHVRWGEHEATSEGPEGAVVIEAPVELLREIHLVDTPGTNAIDRRHEALTRDFVPRADLILFVTSADRPFTESERQFLAAIREWGKKVVVAINKADILASPGEVDQVVEFVRRSCRDLLGFEPEVFALSARRALAARESAGGASDPGFAALERYVLETLDQRERIRLKLENPARVALRLLDQASTVIAARVELLREDLTTLEGLGESLQSYQDDLEREFKFRLGDVEKRLHQLRNRGDEFFDDVLRLTRLPDLFNRSKIRDEFERKVVADMPREVEAQVSDLIDWLVASELRQWQGVQKLVRGRLDAHEGRVAGGLGEAFESHRQTLLDTLGRTARRAVDGYDRHAEAKRLAESVQTAVASAALLEVGAVGLGAVVAAVASSTAVDVTGLLAAGALAALGLFVIPARRRRAKSTLRERLEQLRAQLMSGLQSQFESELRRSTSRLEEAVAPYTRFVRGERRALEERESEADALRDELERLLERIAGR
ncbi:MAG TPA: dynamin family protein [Thermoanaerobaculia bacterium]|nr:dynamin family protein [Thermoanaerobaculia bacterium]